MSFHLSRADDPLDNSESKQQQQHYGSSSNTTSTTLLSSGDSILSEKVSRALQVRTDTPAMKAALDALAVLSTTTTSVVAAAALSSSSSPNQEMLPMSSNHSQSSTTTSNNDINSKSNNNNTFLWIDSRSVRVVMEQDALQQALLLQEQLRQLVEQVSELRNGVTRIASIATKVQDAIHTNVVSPTTHTYNSNNSIHQKTLTDADRILLNDSSERTDPGMTTTTLTTTTTATSAADDSTSLSSQLEQEQKLAAILYDSFRHRQVSRQRLEAVMTFLEKFDLSEQDARLLDHYAFEDVGAGAGAVDPTNVPVNGMAFLTALHRVRNIRQALGQTFGTTSASTSMDAHTSSLLSNSNSSSTFGATSALRMMESLAQKQEKAYERLYHWLQKFLHLHTAYATTATASSPDGSIGNNYNTLYEDADDMLDEALIQNMFVKRALQTLQHVPAFYAHTLELIATSRRGRETRKFLLALTSGYNGMPPLELKAHDAVQYVGDMLAFMFQQTNMEADVAKHVLIVYQPQQQQQQVVVDGDNSSSNNNEDEGQENDGWWNSNRSEDENTLATGDDRPMTASEMVSQAMGGVARPLKSRILQVIANLARRGDEDEGDEDDEDDRHRRGIGHRGGGGVEDDLDEEGSVARRKICQLYEICGLLSFYHSALNKTIQKLQTLPQQQQQQAVADKDEAQVLEDETNVATETLNPLVGAILECWTAATNGYVASLRVYGATLDQLAVLTGESEASLAHALMVQLAQVRISSPGFVSDMALPNAFASSATTTATPNAAKGLSLEWIMETLIDSSLPLCKTLDDALLLKQGLAVAKKAGMSGGVASVLEDRIQEQESKLIDGLVEMETSHVLELSGLGSVAMAWKRFQELYAEDKSGSNSNNNNDAAASVTAVMAGHPGLSQSQLEAAMKEFYASLYSPPLPSLERSVENVALRKLARQKIAANVADLYADVYKEALRPASGYTDVSFLGHTPEQVKTLFSA